MPRSRHPSGELRERWVVFVSADEKAAAKQAIEDVRAGLDVRFMQPIQSLPATIQEPEDKKKSRNSRKGREKMPKTVTGPLDVDPTRKPAAPLPKAVTVAPRTDGVKIVTLADKRKEGISVRSKEYGGSGEATACGSINPLKCQCSACKAWRAAIY